jgi:uncharacterized membrane protein YbaN (DUF454 family)
MENQPNPDHPVLRQTRFARIAWVTVGHTAVGFAAVGAVLPLIPATPFLLIAAYCYSRGSLRFYNWLFTNRYFGHYLTDYRAGKGIPLRVKVLTLLFMWPSTIVMVLFVIPHLWLKLTVLVIPLALSVHILLLKTKKTEE